MFFLSSQVGGGECKSQPQGEGKVIPCLVEYYDQIETAACQNYINKMATIIFSDYRFMSRFMDDCFDDIKDHKCGRLEEQEDDDVSKVFRLLVLIFINKLVFWVRVVRCEFMVCTLLFVKESIHPLTGVYILQVFPHIPGGGTLRAES